MGWSIVACWLALLGQTGGAEGPVEAAGGRSDAGVRLAAVVDDASTAGLTNGKHYYASNERDLHLFEPTVRGLGGALVAVAADPGYVLAGWMRASLVVFVDLDPEIVALHSVYAALFAASATPEAFLGLWADAGRERAVAVISGAAPAAEVARSVAVFLAAQPEISRRFADLGRRMAASKTRWFGDDQALFDHVRGLVTTGQVVVKRADLTREGAALAIGAGLTASGEAVGALYLSNIEQYFMYNTGFRAVVGALPFSAEGVALRTLPGRPAGFEYIAQNGRELQGRLGDRRVRSVYRLRGFSKREDPGAFLQGRSLFWIRGEGAGEGGPRVGQGGGG